MNDVSGVADQSRELGEASHDAAWTRIQDLEAQRLSLVSERKRVAREFKNETQKHKRLMAKARNLSTDELLNFAVSHAAAAKANAKANSSD